MGLKINPIKLEGRWRSGFALDLHTLSSTPVRENQFGHMQFDSVRPEIAEHLFRLKNRSDMVAAQPIIEAAANFVRPSREKFNLLVPVPPSTQRQLQPVLVLADGIAKSLSLPFSSCVTTTRPTLQLKNVANADERKKLLEGLYAVDATVTTGKNVLLFDDLYRSGATLNAITDLLLGEGKAAAVYALTITKTRSNQ